MGSEYLFSLFFFFFSFLQSKRGGVRVCLGHGDLSGLVDVSVFGRRAICLLFLSLAPSSLPFLFLFLLSLTVHLSKVLGDVGVWVCTSPEVALNETGLFRM